MQESIAFYSVRAGHPELVASAGEEKHLDRVKLESPAAEGQGAKVLVDRRQQSLGSGQTQWYMAASKFFM